MRRLSLKGLTSSLPDQAPSDAVAEPRDRATSPAELVSPFPTTPTGITGPRNTPAKQHQSPLNSQTRPFPAPIAISSPPLYSQSQPVRIPSVSIHQRDPNRVPTPLSGRGNRKGHLFPFVRTPSPTTTSSSHSPNKHQFSPEAVNARLGQEPLRRSSSSPLPPRSHHGFAMHGEQLAARYTPSSPLSPKLMSNHRPLSPQPQRSRANHSRQTSRTMHMNLPRYHPANFQHNDTPGATSSAQSPTMGMQRDGQVMQNESPRLMRERQRELIDRARMSSRIAASPMGIKPDAPRLDPLGSPKGAVTPLALEEAADYFERPVVAGSPASSPGARSDGSVKELGESKPKKFSKVDTAR